MLVVPAALLADLACSTLFEPTQTAFADPRSKVMARKTSPMTSHSVTAKTSALPWRTGPTYLCVMWIRSDAEMG